MNRDPLHRGVVPGPEPAVDVRDAAIRVDSARPDAGVAEARRRYGGLDLPATLAGTVAALGMTVLVGGLLAGAGTVSYQLGLKGQGKLSAGALLAGLVALAAGFFFGGWVAGRMARYDGARNGLMTAVWFLVLGAATAVLGAWLGRSYDVFARLSLPQWFASSARTTRAVATGVLAVASMLCAGWLGGLIGGRYHRGADAVIARTREGGLARPGATGRAR